MAIATIALLCRSGGADAGVGESAVITLVFPHGARTLGMGEVGVALADDEHVAYWNPAGLGVDNQRWHTGAGCWFYERLLPAFRIRDLWHFQTAGVWQPASGKFGGFSLDYNYINMGVNQWYDESGRMLGASLSSEYVLTLGWGADLFNTGRHYFGVNGKFFQSRLAPGIGDNGEGTANGVACDLGYLWRGTNGPRFGITAANIGPSVFYISSEERDPIPFTIRAAVAYVNDFGIDNWTIFSVACETMIEREFVKNYTDRNPDAFIVALFTSTTDDPLEEELSEIQVHWGGELRFLETLALRTGFLFDWVGERYELSLGLGTRLFGHFDIDWSTIHSPEGFLRSTLRKIDPEKDGASGARHGQWRISIAATDLLDWSMDDRIPFNFEHLPAKAVPPPLPLP